MSAVESPAELTLRVGDFEGPLDLLLHLARTQEIDLASLPVRIITDQYLAHLEAMAFRDLEAAGAYLVMAATLIYLKSKLLVPPRRRGGGAGRGGRGPSPGAGGPFARVRPRQGRGGVARPARGRTGLDAGAERRARCRLSTTSRWRI